MKPLRSRTSLPSRRTFLQSIFAAGALPWIVPASALGKEGNAAPSNKIALGVLGVGAQGQWDMRAFLNHNDVQVAAICDVNKRNIESARRIIGVKQGRRLLWNPQAERFENDTAANEMLQSRPMRGPWRLA